MSVRRILVIEDDPLVRKLANVMLTSAGYDVEEATDGEEGVASYRRQPSDLVITDMLMPNQDGLATIRALTQLDPRVKIIAMSGGGDGPLSYLDAAMRLGALDILRKPFTRDALLAAVRNASAA
jgi:DNA-binding NtrC family response regulator